MSNRAAEYRGLVEDVISGGLLDDVETSELRDMLARVERKVRAATPSDQPAQREAAE